MLGQCSQSLYGLISLRFFKMYSKTVFKRLIPAVVLFSAAMASPMASASVPEVQLIVLSLGSQTLRQCERSSLRFLNANGFETSVRREGSQFVKIFGEKAFDRFSLQLECDRSLNTKALAFSHPRRARQSLVDAIIEGLLE